MRNTSNSKNFANWFLSIVVSHGDGSLINIGGSKTSMIPSDSFRTGKGMIKNPVLSIDFRQTSGRLPVDFRLISGDLRRRHQSIPNRGFCICRYIDYTVIMRLIFLMTTLLFLLLVMILFFYVLFKCIRRRSELSRPVHSLSLNSLPESNNDQVSRDRN